MLADLAWPAKTLEDWHRTMNAERPVDRPASCDPAIWLEQYGDLLFRYALVRIRNRELAEDLVQKTFLAALRARDRFSGQSSEGTWLVGILRHKHCRSHAEGWLRASGRPVRSSRLPACRFFNRKGHWKLTPAKWPLDPVQVLEIQEFWKSFRACTSGLPPLLAGAFCLRELEGHESEEVCNILAISPSNLSVRLHRTQMYFRRCLEMSWFTGKD